MQNWKHIAHEAKDLLTVCLAKAVDQAMTAQAGPDWFVAFAQADSQMKLNLRITKAGQLTVQDMDLQALLKLFRFREGMARQVLAYHGFFLGQDAIAIDAQMHQLNQLLDRLMVDFRNRIEAHSRAADIEREINGQDLNRIYGYEEAVQDMLRLARIFGNVKDPKGMPYYRRIENLSKTKSKWWIPVVVILPLLAVAAGALWWYVADNGDGDEPPAVAERVNVFYDDSDPEIQEGDISIQPVYAAYEGNTLVLDCYIINGTDEEITDIYLSDLALWSGDDLLAQASFEWLELEGQNITLGSGESVCFGFVFKADAVQMHEAELRDLYVTYSCTLPDKE